jgi:hypothetical protein
MNITASKIRKQIAALLLSVAALSAVFSAAPASAAPAARWLFVGRENFTINDTTAYVPTYVNANSIEGDQYDVFTITFQARYNGRNGINRVNVGVIVDCTNYTAVAEQFYVYYGKSSRNFDRLYGGDLSDTIMDEARSYCFYD